MLIIDFPLSPTIGQVYTQNSISWIWNGITWDIYSQYPTKPIHLTYNTTSDMLNDQLNQYFGFIYYIISDNIYYEKLNSSTNSILDYRIIGGVGSLPEYGFGLIEYNDKIRLGTTGSNDNYTILDFSKPGEDETYNEFFITAFESSKYDGHLQFYHEKDLINNYWYLKYDNVFTSNSNINPSNYTGSIIYQRTGSTNPTAGGSFTSNRFGVHSWDNSTTTFSSVYLDINIDLDTTTNNTTHGAILIDSRYNRGMYYGGNYESNFIPRSLITKQYVDNKLTNDYVPYISANKNVDLGEYGITTGFIKLDITPTNTPIDQGTIYWDDRQETAALIMNGSIQHIGQDTFFYVKNSSGSTILKGICVQFAGTDGNSGHLLIQPFLANGTVPSQYFMGVTSEDIPNGEFGKVMHFGKLDGINTSAFSNGAILYVSTTVPGGFQTAVPLPPNNIIIVAAVVSSGNNGKLMIRPTLGSNINNDEGVLILTPSNNQLLAYTTANGLWENKSLGIIIGGTSNQFVKGNGSLDSTIYTPTTRTLTFTTNNGLTGGASALDLSVDRSWTFGLTGQALALHNLSTNGLIVRTGVGTVTARTITAGTGISITNGDGVSGNPNINSTITQYTDALARIAISLTTTGNSGASTYNNTTGVFNIPNYTLAGLGGEPAFTKGDLIQGSGIVLTGTLTSRLVGSGNITIDHQDTSTQSTVINSTGNVIQSITLDTFGHITLLNSVDLDTRYYTETEVNTILNSYQLLSQKAQANGYTPLDSGAKVPLIHLPDSILGQVRYMGTWNANTNTPTLINPPASTTKGEYYVVSSAGTFAGIEYNIGDWIISNGTSWEKVDNTDAVSTVFGRLGNILALATDYSGFYVRHDTNSQGLNTTQQGNARTNIDAQITITGAATTVTTANLTINRALISDSSGKIVISNVTSTELGYLVGVTSSIQTQLNSKLTTNQSITLSGDVTGTGATAITTTISNNVVTDAKLRQSVGYSVIGRSTGTTGNVADIVASTDGVLRRNGSGDLIFGTLVTGNIGDSQVTYAKIQNVSADRILGRITTNGIVQELTAAQIRTLINVQEGANLYTHPVYTPINQTLNGATVLATFTTDTIGSVTTFTTRSLTAGDISAVPTTRTLTFTTNNGLTGGTTAVDLSTNRSFTFGLTGQSLALHNLATNGLIVRTGAGTIAARTLVAGANIEITNADGVAGNPTISLADSTYSFDEETFTYSGSTDFTLSVTTPFAVEVFLNGQRLVKTLDWTIAGNVVTVSAPLDTNNPDEIVISYFYNTPDIVLPGLTGSGTTNFVTKWGSSSSLTSSSIQDDGTTITIGGSEILTPNIGTVTSENEFIAYDATTGLKRITASNLLISIGAQPSGNYVTTDTTQTVSGLKIFKQDYIEFQENVGSRHLRITPAISGVAHHRFTSTNTSAGYQFENNGGILGSFNSTGTLTISAQATSTVHAVRADRTITAGTGLTGGGNLTADRTLSFDTTWGDARYVTLTTDQTITGTKTFSRNLIVANTIASGGDVNTLNSNTRLSGGFILNGALNVPASGNLQYFNIGPFTLATIDSSNENYYIRSLYSPTNFTSWRTIYHTGNLVNPVTGTGVAGQVAFWNGTTTQTGSNNLFWDNTNGRLGIGTTTPVNKIEIFGANVGLAVNAGASDRSVILSNGTDGTGTLYLFNGSNSNTVFVSGNGASFFNGGNVGIGTSTISEKLHLYNGKFLVETAAATDPLVLSMKTTNVGTVWNSYIISDYFGQRFNTNIYHGMSFVGGRGSFFDNFRWFTSTFSELMTLHYTGNLSIGKGNNPTDSGEKLQINGDIKLKNNILSNQENIDVDSAAPEVVAQISSTTYTAAFFDFSIKNGTNLRAGTVYATHDGTNVVFTETSTADLGNTSGVELSVDILSGNLRLLATVTTDNWIIKSLVRGL
jgi:hypothetical protein